MKTHNIKIRTEPLLAVIRRAKTFEIRKNDRGYEENDVVVMTDPEGRSVMATVGYVTDFEQKKGWCVFSLRNIVRGKKI